ncbi:hypothetical protein BDZ89DRAFT_269112 [Hymenopellis radicata]|nr:hypothetical protein BDZ89DRAFT_269112 [Hymenopellis radicata]
MSSSDTKAIRDAYFNACNFESLMRGIHFSVFWMALVHIYTGKRSRHKHVMAVLVIAMFIMSTVHNATFWAYVRRAFIAYGDTSETVAAALNEYPSWFTGTTAISDLNAVLADGILVRITLWHAAPLLTYK